MTSHNPNQHGHSHSGISSPSPLNMLLIVTAVSAVLTVIAGLATGDGQTFWFPVAASTVAPKVDFLFNFITWISIFFFVLITILMVYFMVKYRRRAHEKATSDVTHNTTLELTWTIIPLILVIVIFYVGMKGYLDLRVAPEGSYEVHVTGQRWSWSFEHRNGLNETNILLVPANRPVRLLMQSPDVLHAVFIPAFRVKQDIVPGRITDLWFNTKPGEFELFCAEYCGKDHSQMHAMVQALPEAEFQAELTKRVNILPKLAIEEYPDYALKSLFPRCASCHSLDGKDGTGPTWRGLWSHLERGDVVFTDGTRLADVMGPGKMFENAEDYVRRSILDPQQKTVMNFGNAMPTFKGQLDELKIKAIIELLKHLDEFDDKGKPKPGTPAAERAAKPKATVAAPISGVPAS